MRNKKDIAVSRLRAAGYKAEASALEVWRNRLGDDGGWDGHVRRAFPNLVEVCGLHAVTAKPALSKIHKKAREPVVQEEASLLEVAPELVPGEAIPHLPDLIVLSTIHGTVLVESASSLARRNR